LEDAASTSSTAFVASDVSSVRWVIVDPASLLPTTRCQFHKPLYKKVRPYNMNRNYFYLKIRSSFYTRSLWNLSEQSNGNFDHCDSYDEEDYSLDFRMRNMDEQVI
jgi:hypothetical protein